MKDSLKGTLAGNAPEAFERLETVVNFTDAQEKGKCEIDGFEVTSLLAEVDRLLAAPLPEQSSEIAKSYEAYVASEEQPKAAVLPMTGRGRKPGRPKKQPQDGSEPKPKAPPIGLQQADLAVALINHLKGAPLKMFPPMKFTLAARADDKGKPHPFEINSDNVCRDIDIEIVTNKLLNFCHRSAIWPYDTWTYKQAEGCAKMWLALSSEEDLSPTPAPFAFLSEESKRCYHRLPFDVKPGSMPLAEELFSRMSNAEAVAAFIWSCFEPKANRQQYVWIYGQGNDGKGTLMRWLQKIVGTAGQVQQNAPDTRNKHWALPYVNKRVIIYPDFDDYEALSRGVFKSITGEDPVFIDPKGKAGYTERLICKLFFTSNGMPGISTSRSDLRRIIFGEMSVAPRHDPQYEEKLWLEAGAILAYCRDVYRRLCPDHGLIPVTDESKEAIENHAASREAEFELFFDDNIGIERTRETLQNDLQVRLRNYFPSSNIQGKFKAWMERKYGFVVVRETRGSSRPRLYKGFYLKPYPYLRS
jgi:hypothetical protein